MSVEVRHAELRDVPSVAVIEGDAFPQERPAEERVREELARPWTRAWVACEEGVVVGYLIAWQVADELHVLQVAAARSERRKGVGLALVEAALRYAVAEHDRLVLLEVRRSNVAAIALYRRAGFAATHLRARYYSDGEAAVEMLVELDPATGERVPRRDEIGLPG